MARNIVQVKVVSSVRIFDDATAARDYALRVLQGGAMVSMEWAQVPGESDAEKASRLARELAQEKAARQSCEMRLAQATAPAPEPEKKPRKKAK